MGHATSIIKHFLTFFSITTISVLQCSICLSTLIQASHRIFRQTQPYARTTFQILLVHTSCIRLNGCSNIICRVSSWTLSALTYHNHSLCARRCPHVFHITCIYLRHPYDKTFCFLFQISISALVPWFSWFFIVCTLPNWPCILILFN